MEKYQEDESFLARWAAGELTPEEQAEFEKSEAFKEFHKINDVAQKFDAPPIDQKKSLIAINEKITFGQKKKSVLNVAVAATISILIVTTTFLLSNKTYTTSFGEQLAIVLPDGSQVQLNSSSKLSHKRFFWINNKRVNLNGEGFFEVEKGDGFQVHSEYGIVSVLGTRFNVKARPKRFAVECYEGKVKVAANHSEQEVVLNPGESTNWMDEQLILNKIIALLPSWMTGISTFNQEALFAVLSELTAQFGVEFKTEGIDLSQQFTGSFEHGNLRLALRSTLEPMDIAYDIDDKNQLVILK